MMLEKFFAKQLRKPSGLFGKYLLTRALNKTNKAMNDSVLQLLDVQPNDHILEIGFGGGDLLTRMTMQIESGAVTGVDFSPDMVEIGRKRFRSFINRGKLELHCMDADSLSFTANTFDKICTVNTLYFWPDVNKVLVSILDVLQSKGVVIICFSTKETMDDIGQFTQYGFSKYSIEEVQKFLQNAGFINIRTIEGKDNQGEFVNMVGEKY